MVVTGNYKQWNTAVKQVTGIGPVWNVPENIKVDVKEAPNTNPFRVGDTVFIETENYSGSAPIFYIYNAPDNKSYSVYLRILTKKDAAGVPIRDTVGQISDQPIVIPPVLPETDTLLGSGDSSVVLTQETEEIAITPAEESGDPIANDIVSSIVTPEKKGLNLKTISIVGIALIALGVIVYSVNKRGGKGAKK